MGVGFNHLAGCQKHPMLVVDVVLFIHPAFETVAEMTIGPISMPHRTSASEDLSELTTANMMVSVPTSYWKQTKVFGSYES